MGFTSRLGSKLILLLALWAFGLVSVAQAATEQGTSASAKKAKKKAAADKKSKATSKPGAKSGAKSKKSKASKKVAVVERPSYGQTAGLHATSDPLELKSSVALVIDQDTHEVLVGKNQAAVLPIASLTKLMTGVVVSDARLPMDETITITQADVDTEKGSRSRLKVGTTLTRGELLHLALMSSENRAAHALGRTYPGGMEVFVSQMNARASALGMTSTRYVEPTGLNSRNQSSANDLAVLVGAAYMDPMLRDLTTSPGYQVAVGKRVVNFHSTNRLISNPTWDIGLQKTGYISEAGRCLVMQAKIAGRKLIMVFLDSAGKLSRIGDAERVRRWVEANSLPATRVASATHG